MTDALHSRAQAVLPDCHTAEKTSLNGPLVTGAVDKNSAKYFSTLAGDNTKAKTALAALTTALGLAKGADRTKAVAKAWGDAKKALEKVRGEIEALANDDSENAQIIIVAGGCTVKRPGGSKRKDFGADPGPELHSLLASWPAYDGIGTVAYTIQWCLDGLNWANDKTTVVAHFVLRGLPASSQIHIRYKAVYGENVETAWFPAIEVHVA
jgi:hypothetical protein